MLAAHTEADGRDLVLRAPASGQFSASAPMTYTTEGELVTTEQTIGIVQTRDGGVQITSPVAGFLMDVIGEPGAPVRRGQVVARIRACTATDSTCGQGGNEWTALDG